MQQKLRLPTYMYDEDSVHLLHQNVAHCPRWVGGGGESRAMGNILV